MSFKFPVNFSANFTLRISVDIVKLLCSCRGTLKTRGNFVQTTSKMGEEQLDKTKAVFHIWHCSPDFSRHYPAELYVRSASLTQSENTIGNYLENLHRVSGRRVSCLLQALPRQHPHLNQTEYFQSWERSFPVRERLQLDIGMCLNTLRGVSAQPFYTELH